MKITKLTALEVLDSRGTPTIEVDIVIENKYEGRAIVPSGASTGIHEALELRDEDKSRYGGKGVLEAVENVEKIIGTKIVGKEINSQKELDDLLINLDGTENKSKLGANAILGVSIAFCVATANYMQIPTYEYISKLFDVKPSLPRPMFNVMNGGRHANWSTDIQEYMIIPMLKTSFAEHLRIGSEIFHALEKLLDKKGLSINVGNEGGFAPKLGSDEEALQLLVEAIETAGFKPGSEVCLGMDIAASEFFIENKKGESDDQYNLKTEKKILTKSEWLVKIQSWIKKYPIISIEDPFSQDAWYSWHDFLKSEENILEQVVGDDLLVTNVERIEKAMKMNSCNALLVKLNQIGTVSETLKAMRLAKSFGWKNIVSHRSGETEDVFIAHLAVGTGAGQIKSGAPSRTDRVAKYNELLRIEEELKQD